MIISHKHKIIFMHCKKTGGSTVKLNMYPSLGERDIVIGGLQEVLESGITLKKQVRKDIMKPAPLTYYAAQRARGKSHSAALNFAIKMAYKEISSISEPEHACATEIRAFFPYEFSNYYKFAFIRNPFTQVASEYFWRLKTMTKVISFSDFLDFIAVGTVEKISERARTTNFEIISIGDSVVCDFVGRFESLSDDFHKISKTIGIDCQLRLPAKVGNNSVEKYQNCYTSNDIKKVKEIFRPEIETFDYSWPFK